MLVFLCFCLDASFTSFLVSAKTTGCCFCNRLLHNYLLVVRGVSGPDKSIEPDIPNQPVNYPLFIASGQNQIEIVKNQTR